MSPMLEIRAATRFFTILFRFCSRSQYLFGRSMWAPDSPIRLRVRSWRGYRSMDARVNRSSAACVWLPGAGGGLGTFEAAISIWNDGVNEIDKKSDDNAENDDDNNEENAKEINTCKGRTT
eukprot:2588586-Rhodomonas_salina.1